jgi:ABC-type protease/lipase transport system fused ATPase/permease subunit
MMMVLYEGKAIAFGPSEEVFARVRNVNTQAAARPQAPPPAKANQPKTLAEGVPS